MSKPFGWVVRGEFPENSAYVFWDGFFFEGEGSQAAIIRDEWIADKIADDLRTKIKADIRVLPWSDDL